EAGGHGATRATLPLVPQVVHRVRQRAPEAMVVAAGGIGDGRGLAAALMLGAEGVLVGTRFYASEESLGRPQAKARMIEATGEETIRTSVFDTVRGIAWPEGFTGRALNNDFARRWHGAEAELSAAAGGDFSTAVIFAGEAMGLFDRILPAGDIVAAMAAEAEAALSAGAQRITG